MSSIGTSKGVLEIAKFAAYVSVPISLMYLFANNNKNLQTIMGHREYVVYPTESVKPQSPEELREMAKEIARKREREGPRIAELRKMARELTRNPQNEEA